MGSGMRGLVVRRHAERRADRPAWNLTVAPGVPALSRARATAKRERHAS